MTTAPDAVPDDLETLKTAFLAERSAGLEAEARASGAEAMVAHLKLLIAKLKRERFGSVVGAAAPAARSAGAAARRAGDDSDRG